MAYNPLVNEEAREAYFDYGQVVVLDFWVERVKETGMLMMEQRKLGIVLDERVVEGASEFWLWFLARSLENQLSNRVGTQECLLGLHIQTLI